MFGSRRAMVRYPVARGSFGLVICMVQWPWATTMCVSTRQKGPEVHFDRVFTVFGCPGLQICVFRLSEKDP
eukprot:7647169-Heterocapsa_arctica.AAC.1